MLTRSPQDRIRAHVLIQDDGCWLWKGKTNHGYGVIHHRRPRRAGGDPRPETNRPANLVALCGSGTTGCHGWLESRRTEASELGLILHANDDPTEHPVAHAVLGPVLLDNDGGVWPVGDAA